MIKVFFPPESGNHKSRVRKLHLVIEDGCVCVCVRACARVWGGMEKLSTTPCQLMQLLIYVSHIPTYVLNKCKYNYT